MPIYEYRCKNCSHYLEKIQKMSAEPLTQCPDCEQDELQRLVSKAAFKLKGDGWYVTDFKDKKSESTAESTPAKNDKQSASSNTETASKAKSSSAKDDK